MKKRLLSILLVFALCLAFVPAAVSADDDRGVMKYEQIIAPQYEDAGLYSDGLAAVKKDGKWGYIDMDNNVVIPFKYDFASLFQEGLAVVGTFGTYEYDRWVWEDDELVIVPDFDDVIYLGRVDKEGNYLPFKSTWFDWETETHVTEELFRSVEWFDFSEFYYYYGGWVRIFYRVFDRNGTQFNAPMGYSAQFVPTEGLVSGYEWETDAGLVYMDVNGKIVLDLTNVKHYDANWNEIRIPEYDWNNYDPDTYAEWSKYYDQVRYTRYTSNGMPFNQGLAPAWQYTVDRETWDDGYKLGFIDRTGRWVIQPQFDNYWVSGLGGEYRIFNAGGLASVSLDGKFGAIDRTGRVVIPYKYDELSIFAEGVAPFRLNGLYGYVDTTGKEVIPAKYLATSGFSKGIAVAYDGTKAFLIDRTGTMIPGSDVVDLSNYFFENADGARRTFTPGEYVTIRDGNKYGFGKIAFTPLLPERSEMDDWAYEEVIKAIEEDLVPVGLQNLFRNRITRADFSDLVVYALGTLLEMERDELVLEKTGKSLESWLLEYPFSDSVNKDVIAAYALGIVLGYENGTFLPDNNITRAEAAIMLQRTADVLQMEYDDPSPSDFTDRGTVPSWALDAVDFVYSVGVMRGDGSGFNPSGNYTRQQSYMTIYRILLALTRD